MENNNELLDFMVRLNQLLETYDHKSFESGDTILLQINNLIEQKAKELKNHE